MSTIHAIVFSYKGKYTVESIEALANNTDNEIHITLIDKHPLERDKKFLNIKNFTYFHDFWDYQTSPIKIKHDKVTETDTDYILLMTDDIIVSPGWDSKLMSMSEDNVISGSGSLAVDQDSKFFIGRSYQESESFSLTNFIDKNFIFGKTSILKHIPFPFDFKYYGEDEMLSLAIFCKGIDIYSAPNDVYKDLKYRNLENLFAPFSLEHNYNSFVNLIKNQRVTLYEGRPGARSIDSFLDFHKIDLEKLFLLPLQNDDVLYSPYSMNMDNHDDVGGRRFTDGIRTID